MYAKERKNGKEIKEGRIKKRKKRPTSLVENNIT